MKGAGLRRGGGERGREGRSIGGEREVESEGTIGGETGCDATTHNDDSLVDYTRCCSRKTRRKEETQVDRTYVDASRMEYVVGRKSEGERERGEKKNK